MNLVGSGLSSDLAVCILNLLSLLERPSVGSQLQFRDKKNILTNGNTITNETHITASKLHNTNKIKGQRMQTETYSSLGELVHSLLRASTAGLEHIQQASLIRRHADNLRHQLTNHSGALGQSL
jgi:hypothetical protein